MSHDKWISYDMSVALKKYTAANIYSAQKIQVPEIFDDPTEKSK